MFEKYLHLEKLGNSEVSGITEGLCFVFPKLDGTNASIFNVAGKLCAGSRNRQLSEGQDNAGFYSYVLSDPKFSAVVEAYPDWVIYGEFLVPHTVKTYKDEAWRRFYVFDVYDTSKRHYLSYYDYVDIIASFGLDYLKPLEVVDTPDISKLTEVLKSNTYSVKEGHGIGEGIVIKNYTFVNRYGRYASAKMIADDFKQANIEKSVPNVLDAYHTEQQIIDYFCTEHFVKKTYHKILTEADNTWEPKKHIPELLGRVWYDMISEEMWNILKKFKGVTLNFKMLQSKAIVKVKKTLPEVF